MWLRLAPVDTSGVHQRYDQRQDDQRHDHDDGVDLTLGRGPPGRHAGVDFCRRPRPPPPPRCRTSSTSRSPPRPPRLLSTTTTNGSTLTLTLTSAEVVPTARVLKVEARTRDDAGPRTGGSDPPLEGGRRGLGSGSTGTRVSTSSGWSRLSSVGAVLGENSLYFSRDQSYKNRKQLTTTSPHTVRSVQLIHFRQQF